MKLSLSRALLTLSFISILSASAFAADQTKEPSPSGNHAGKCNSDGKDDPNCKGKHDGKRHDGKGHHDGKRHDGKHHDGERHGNRAHSPLQPLFQIALNKLELNESQKKEIVSAKDKLRQASRANQQSLEKLFLQVAADIKSDKFDKKKVTTEYQKLTGPNSALQIQMAQSLDSLHKNLDDSQRKLLIAEAEKQFKERGQNAKKHHPDAAKRKEHFEKFIAKLNLNEKQRQSLESKIPKEEFSEAKMKKMHELRRSAFQNLAKKFSSNQFNASSELKKLNQAHAHHPADKMIRMISVIQPILDKSQRATLSKMIENRVSKHSAMADHSKKKPTQATKTKAPQTATKASPAK